MIFVLFSIPNVDATPYGKKILDSDSLFIQFGDDKKEFGNKVNPILERLEVKSNGSMISIHDPEFRIMGNSFTIKSITDEYGVIIFGINHNSSFNLRTILFVEDKIIKFNDHAELSNSTSQYASTIPETTQKPNNLHILIQSPKSVFNSQDFDFDIKSFDKSKYSGNDFQNFFGKIDNVEIIVVVKNPQGDTIETLNGITTYGVFRGKIHVPENLWPAGWYSIDISAHSDLGDVQKTISFYVMGQTPPKGNTCTTPPC